MRAHRFSLSSLAIVLAIACLGPLGHAQTCANPIPIYQHTTVTGTSCGANSPPALNHGTIMTPGDDVVYHVVPGGYGAMDASMSVAPYGDGFPDVLFLCRTPCGTNSECVDAGSVVSSGIANVSFPDITVPGNDGDYYLIVDSTGDMCGYYSLTVNGPLGARPTDLAAQDAVSGADCIAAAAR